MACTTMLYVEEHMGERCLMINKKSGEPTQQSGLFYNKDLGTGEKAKVTLFLLHSIRQIFSKYKCKTNEQVTSSEP